MRPRVRAPRARARGRPLRLLLACSLLMGCASDGPPPEGSAGDLRQAVLDLVDRSQRASGSGYRSPSATARRDVAQAVLLLGEGDAERAQVLLSGHDYRLAGTRPASIAQPVRVPDGRGWGFYAVQERGRPLVVEVPHPRADLRTEHLGAALVERTGAQYLLVAGAHRDRGDGDADVAHRSASVFAAVHEATARRGLAAVQLHGYAHQSAPGFDVVVSPGAAAMTPLVQEIASALDVAGFRTCRAWQEDCGRLEGRTNVQGVASAEAGAAFAHVEVARAVRDDGDRRGALVEALAGAVTRTVPGAGGG